MLATYTSTLALSFQQKQFVCVNPMAVVIEDYVEDVVSCRQMEWREHLVIGVEAPLGEEQPTAEVVEVECETAVISIKTSERKGITADYFT